MNPADTKTVEVTGARWRGDRGRPLTPSSWSAQAPDITADRRHGRLSGRHRAQAMTAATLANPVGTGPYKPESNEVGVKQVLVKNPEPPWWGTAVYGGPYLDRIEYIDLGTDPSAAVVVPLRVRARSTPPTSRGEFIDQLDGLGWTKSEAVTSATLAVRFNQLPKSPTRTATSAAPCRGVDNNAVVLELGYSNLGTVAENHHVCPIHPEYLRPAAAGGGPCRRQGRDRSGRAWPTPSSS
jgi:hypothetical protein